MTLTHNPDVLTVTIGIARAASQGVFVRVPGGRRTQPGSRYVDEERCPSGLLISRHPRNI
jgi:hypothetical protein